MSQQEVSTRKVWSKEETLGFLQCYLERKDEFRHNRKKKLAYANVLEDMISQGITSPSMTTTALEGKMRTLSAAYKVAKEKNSGLVVGAYMNKMDEIFGDRTMSSPDHTFHLGSSSISNMSASENGSSFTKVELYCSDDENSADEHLLVPLSPRPSTSAELNKSNVRKRKPDDEEYFEVGSKIKKEPSEPEEGETHQWQHKQKSECLSMPDQQKLKRKVWNKEETIGFLKCYLARKEEFQHSRKKIHAYANVLKDMISQGITSPSTTTFTLEGKMRTLLLMYRTAQAKAKKLGAISIDCEFSEEMQQIFGYRPDSFHDHTIISNNMSDTENESASDEDQPAESMGEDQPDPLSPTHSPSNRLSHSNNLRKRKSAKEKYYEACLKMKKEQFLVKQAAKQSQRAEFMRLALESLKEKWKTDTEIENRKLALLEALLKN